MKMDLTKDNNLECPYCGEIMYLLNNSICFCADCRKKFFTITGDELDKDGNFVKEQEKK